MNDFLEFCLGNDGGRNHVLFANLIAKVRQKAQYRRVYCANHLANRAKVIDGMAIYCFLCTFPRKIYFPVENGQLVLNVIASWLLKMLIFFDSEEIPQITSCCTTPSPTKWSIGDSEPNVPIVSSTIRSRSIISRPLKRWL